MEQKKTQIQKQKHTHKSNSSPKINSNTIDDANCNYSNHTHLNNDMSPVACCMLRCVGGAHEELNKAKDDPQSR